MGGGTTGVSPPRERPRPRPLIPEWLRADLAPRPGRWRHAAYVAAAGAAAVGIGAVLQLDALLAPMTAVRTLAPNVVSTPRNLVSRLVAVALAAVVALHLAGILVAIPWAMLPVFLLAMSALTYIVPIRHCPVRGYVMGLAVASIFYSSVFAVDELGTKALNEWGSCAVGLVVATVMAMLSRSGRPRARLNAALAAGFAQARASLGAAGARFRAQTPPAAEPLPPVDMEGLPQHLQLLDMIREEGVPAALEHAYLALVTASENIDLFLANADFCSRKDTGRTYRRVLDAELAALLGAIDTALARFEEAAKNPANLLQGGTPGAAAASASWPDLDAHVAALRARQEAAVESGELAAVGVEESANLNSFAQALAGMAGVLHSPPEMVGRVDLTPPPRTKRLLPFDPYAAAFALKVGVACCLGLIIGSATHASALETIVMNPIILAQPSYGATIRMAGLRMAGVATGGLLSMLTVVAFMPNTTSLALWLTVFFTVILISTYVGQGTSRIAYFGTQTGVTYMIVLVWQHPVLDINPALWRLLGTLAGCTITLAIFELLVPDYAGRQLVSRFIDILRLMRPILPRQGRPVAPVAETHQRNVQIVTALTDVLRLAEEARYEVGREGVDRKAAVASAGLMRRVAHRWALIRRLRRESRPPLPPALQEAIGSVEDALLARMEELAAFLDARHHRDRPNSALHRAACAAALEIAVRPRPPLDGMLAAMTEAVATWRSEVAPQWPVAAASNLLSEVEHWQRLAVLVPALTDHLHRMCLPTAAEELSPADSTAASAALAPTA